MSRRGGTILQYELYVEASAAAVPVDERHAAIGQAFGRASGRWSIDLPRWPACPDLSRSLLKSVKLTGVLGPGLRGAIDYRYRQRGSFDSLSLTINVSDQERLEFVHDVLPGLITAFEADEMYCDPRGFAVEQFFQTAEAGGDPSNRAYCVHQVWFVDEDRARQRFALGIDELAARVMDRSARVIRVNAGLLMVFSVEVLDKVEWTTLSQPHWVALGGLLPSS